MEKRRSAATFAFLAALPLLTGCDNCNILGGNMSTGCRVGLGAGAILAAPILIPYVLIEEAAESNSRQTRAARQVQAAGGPLTAEAPAGPTAAADGIKDPGTPP
jgi:hypothetical protein